MIDFMIVDDRFSSLPSIERRMREVHVCRKIS